MRIVCATPLEVEPGCFVVMACIGNGKVLYHNGPKDYAFWTKEEATKLADRVDAVKAINTEHWWDGRIDRQADAEWEYIEREAGRA